jgi:hypothetical protein
LALERNAAYANAKDCQAETRMGRPSRCGVVGYQLCHDEEDGIELDLKY